MDKGYDIGVYILITISIVMGLFVVNWLITFYKLWSDLHVPSISIRRPKSVILFGILCSVALLIRNPVQFFFSLDPVLFAKMYFFQHILLHFTTIGIVYILVYRGWMIHYEIRWNQALEDEEWQSQINTKTLKQSWFIKNKKKYGNSKYVAIALFIPWSINCSFGSIAVLVQGRSHISQLFYVSNLLTSFILLIILSCKIPVYNDYYKLRKETKMLSLLTIVCLSLFVLLTFGLNASPGQWKWSMLQLIHITLIFSLTFISYYWVFKQFKLPSNLYTLRQYRVGTTLSSYMSNSKNSADVTMCDVLKNDELFILYARHLSSMFAIENLLFFIESNQLLFFIAEMISKLELSSDKTDVVSDGAISVSVSDGSKNKDKTDSTIDFEDVTFQLNNQMDKLEFCEKVPQSTIVSELMKNKNNDINKAAINLFLKYVDYDDAYFLINISFESRKNLCALFGLNNNDNPNNLTKEELMSSFMNSNNISLKNVYTAFDDCRMEIFKLLTSGFPRFIVLMIKQN